MIRRSPCDLYLKYLLVHPERLSDEAIVRRLFDEQLEGGGVEYVGWLRLNCVPPEGFQPANLHHAPSERFLFKHGIKRLFFPDDGTREARRILADLRVKEFAEAMFLAGAPTVAIANWINGRSFDLHCTTEGLNAYKKFYWDVDKLDSTERRALMRMRPIGALLHGRPENLDDANVRYRREAEAEALEKAAYRDPRRIAADLPHAPISSVLVQLYMGAEPTEIDLALLLNDTRRLMILRANEEARANQPGAAKRARDWVASLKDLKEIMDGVASPAEELQRQLGSLRLKPRRSSAPVIHELTGGRHTIDLQPQPEPEEDDDAAGSQSP